MAKKTVQNPKVKKTKVGKINRITGALYYVDGKGNIMQVPARKGGTKGAKHCKS